MNKFIAAGLAVLAIANVSEAIWPITVVGSGAAVTTGAVTVTGAGALAGAALIGGAAIIKGLAIGALLARSGKRGKRSVEEETDAAFGVLAQTEPAQCYRRLICDLAAGAIADNDKVVSALFSDEVSPVSPKFEFATAAKVGKLVKNAQACELRYSCPLSTVEIQKLF